MFDVIILFYISLPTWSNIILCTMVDRERFSVFRVDHWVQKSGHPWAKEISNIVLSFAAEARVRARVSPCGICGGRSGTGTGSSPSSSGFTCKYHSVMPFHHSSIHIYHLGDEQYTRWLTQFRDVVSPHRLNNTSRSIVFLVIMWREIYGN
jgi:hypothetical protein